MLKENTNSIMREIEDIKENPNGTSGGGKYNSWKTNKLWTKIIISLLVELTFRLSSDNWIITSLEMPPWLKQTQYSVFAQCVNLLFKVLAMVVIFPLFVRLPNVCRPYTVRSMRTEACFCLPVHQCPEQCQASGKHSINVLWMNEWTALISFALDSFSSSYLKHHLWLPWSV